MHVTEGQGLQSCVCAANAMPSQNSCTILDLYSFNKMGRECNHQIIYMNTALKYEYEYKYKRLRDIRGVHLIKSIIQMMTEDR